MKECPETNVFARIPQALPWRFFSSFVKAIGSLLIGGLSGCGGGNGSYLGSAADTSAASSRRQSTATSTLLADSAAGTSVIKSTSNEEVTTLAKRKAKSPRHTCVYGCPVRQRLKLREPGHSGTHGRHIPRTSSAIHACLFTVFAQLRRPPRHPPPSGDILDSSLRIIDAHCTAIAAEASMGKES